MNNLQAKTLFPITTRLIFYLLFKLTKMIARWLVYIAAGIVTWLLFDKLPPVILWMLILLILGSMSLHSILHQQNRLDSQFKYYCRVVFFACLPMIFVFAGNRFATWVTSDSEAITHQSTFVTGEVPSKEFLELKAFEKEAFKKGGKGKGKLKSAVSSLFTKGKEMNTATQILLIIVLAVLFILILLVATLYAALDGAGDGCGASSNDSDSCCL